MSRKTFHRLHSEKNMSHAELDQSYAGKHAAHEHKAMQPHELDGHDHAVPAGSKGATVIPNAKADRYTGNNPYPMQPATHVDMED